MGALHARDHRSPALAPRDLIGIGPQRALLRDLDLAGQDVLGHQDVERLGRRPALGQGHVMADDASIDQKADDRAQRRPRRHLILPGPQLAIGPGQGHRRLEHVGRADHSGLFQRRPDGRAPGPAGQDHDRRIALARLGPGRVEHAPAPDQRPDQEQAEGRGCRKQRSPQRTLRVGRHPPARHSSRPFSGSGWHWCRRIRSCSTWPRRSSSAWPCAAPDRWRFPARGCPD